MTGYDITDIYQGGSYSLTLQALDNNSIPLNLSGYSLTSCVKEKYSSPTGIISFSGVFINALSGILQLSLTYLQTSGLPVNTYVYTIEAYNPSTNNILPLFNGYMNVNPTNFSLYTTGGY